MGPTVHPWFQGHLVFGVLINYSPLPTNAPAIEWPSAPTPQLPQASQEVSKFNSHAPKRK